MIIPACVEGGSCLLLWGMWASLQFLSFGYGPLLLQPEPTGLGAFPQRRQTLKARTASATIGTTGSMGSMGRDKSGSGGVRTTSQYGKRNDTQHKFQAEIRQDTTCSGRRWAVPAAIDSRLKAISSQRFTLMRFGGGKIPLHTRSCQQRCCLSGAPIEVRPRAVLLP